MTVTQALTQPTLTDTNVLWSTPQTLYFERKSRTLPLTNFRGRNYPVLQPELLKKLLDVNITERVLEVDATRPIPSQSEYDFVLIRQGLASAPDPAALCERLQTVAPRGFLEAPSPLNEYLGGDPAHRWLVSVEKDREGKEALVFRRKPFGRSIFRHALRGRLHNDADYRFAWEYAYRNVTHTQFAWEIGFAYRVEDDPDGYDPDDPEQRAEAHLDRAIQGVRFGNIPPVLLLPDAEQAVMLNPHSAIAQNTLGCVLWMLNRYAEANKAFREASQLAPMHEGFKKNARAVPNAASPLHLELLPPMREDMEDIKTNFAGKVYYAFVNFDARLADDMGITPTDRVLDVGGGQRPLKRADVSIDFDVFEGAHRQGLTISREKPLVCGDVQRLPFATKAFDVACCRMVLEHVMNPALACKELQRVAKRGFLETPNTFWECFYGHPTHRWVIEWEAETRTIVFKRKPFDRMPFHSAIIPLLYTQGDVQRAFEVSFRNLTTTQVSWDEEHPFEVRVEDDTEDAPYDYMGRAEDATRGSMNYARDIFTSGLAPVAVAEAEDALKLAPNPVLQEEAIRLRLEIATAMNDFPKISDLRSQLRTLTTGINTKFVPQNQTRLSPVIWSAPLLDPSGYADEARHFLFALESAGVSVAARELRWSNKVAALPRERERILQKLLQTPAQASPIRISHILAPSLQSDPQARVNVGRTMFETDRLPADWVEACNRMDEIWVPTEFNRETFTFAGVRPEKLRVVPGTIDLAPYNPHCVPLSIEDARGYNFLSLFDWQIRKGWDVLIRAFVEEFSMSEDVSLTIKTHSSFGYSTEKIVDMVSTYLTESVGCDLNRIPLVIFQDTNIPDAQMPNLYRAADCFVLPTRGEGWGRPFMEAMAMGLPVIGTGWSGQTAFMNEENSFLLDYTLTEVPESSWREIPTYQGHRWAEPSLSHLRQLMREVFEDRKTAKEMGQRARTHLEESFTYSHIAKTLLSEFERLGARF